MNRLIILVLLIMTSVSFSQTITPGYEIIGGGLEHEFDNGYSISIRLPFMKGQSSAHFEAILSGRIFRNRDEIYRMDNLGNLIGTSDFNEDLYYIGQEIVFIYKPVRNFYLGIGGGVFYRNFRTEYNVFDAAYYPLGPDPYTVYSITITSEDEAIIGSSYLCFGFNLPLSSDFYLDLRWELRKLKEKDLEDWYPLRKPADRIFSFTVNLNYINIIK